MNIHEWLRELASYLVLFPAACSCYLPMTHQMKYTPAKTAALCLAVLIPFSLAGAWAQTAFQIPSNTLMFPAMAVFFLLYRRTLKTDLPRALAVYVGVCAVQTFPSQLAAVLDARLNPQTWAGSFSVEAALFQLFLACLPPLLACAVRRQGAWMVDSLDFPKVWYSCTALSGVFLVFNAVAVPDSLRMYYVDRPYNLFPLLEICALTLLMCIYVLFYQGARLILERAQLEQRSQFLEMQSHQYRALQEHMRQTARLRHDFRHSARLLTALAEQGDLEGIRAHLAEYEHSLAENTAVSYCANATLNALFGYYHEMAVSAGVDTNWKIELPEPLTVSELDLASLFGNLIENGIEGCQTLQEGKRYFSLTSEMRHGSSLYIVSTNSFDGRVRKGKNGYCSTKHSGSGLGLLSIAAVAEKYHGIVQTSHSAQEFFVDVVIKI